MLTHFSTALLFALFISIVFGITQRAQPKMMVRFGAYCFVLFVGAVILGSWLMFAIKH
jgi:flagellar biosynthesis protein FliR